MNLRIYYSYPLTNNNHACVLRTFKRRRGKSHYQTFDKLWLYYKKLRVWGV
jgi:hypothetical protein